MTKFKGSMLAKQMESDGSNGYWSGVSNNNSQGRFGSQERQQEVFQSNHAIKTPASSPLPAPSSPGSSNHEGIGKSLESEKVVVMDLTSNGKSHNTIQSGGTSWNQSRPIKIQMSSSPLDHSSIIHNQDHHHSLHPHIQFNGNGNHHHSNHDLLSIDHDRDLSASPSNMSTASSQGSSSYNRGGMSGSPMSHRSRKRNPNPIPDSCKDEAYWERRKRNNESAKRSRELRRIKETQQSNKVTVLEQDNLRLRTEVDMLREELNKLREILYNQNSSGIRNGNF